MATVDRSYVVELVRGHRVTRRGLAFLICQGDEDIDAKATIDGLGPKRDRQIRSRFDYWLDGGTNNKWFHGWDKEGYRDCFVFKWREKGVDHRVYGFLCNPLPHDRGFQLCVLVSHATKSTWETNPSELDAMNALKDEAAVEKAITQATKGLTRPAR